MTRTTASAVFATLPLDSAKGFASAKSQAIESAWRRNVLTTSSFLGTPLQVQRVEWDSVSFSTTNERQTLRHSEYAVAPAPPAANDILSSGKPLRTASRLACSRVSSTKLESVDNITNCLG